MSSGSEPLRLGVVGLGRGFALTASAFKAHPGIDLVAAAAPREVSRAAFEAAFGGRTYSDIDGLCADEDVEAVYIATPHELHENHTLKCARAGKHVIVDKPVATTLAHAQAMVEACDTAGVQFIVGPSHSFDAPVLRARQVIAAGGLGRVRMIHALNCTDFLYRPRRPEELRTEQGGGVLFSQAVHQIDVVRFLAGGLGQSVAAMTGAWDPDRPTEGAYAALLKFKDGAFASLTYSGYGRYDSDVSMGNVDELGQDKPGNSYGAARRVLARTDDESAYKTTRTFTSLANTPQPSHHEHFGPVIVFCEHGDIRLHPDGIELFGDAERRWLECPFRTTRAEFCDALVAALRDGRPPAQTGRWGLASLEVCHAILDSARTGQTLQLHHQIGITHD